MQQSTEAPQLLEIKKETGPSMQDPQSFAVGGFLGMVTTPPFKVQLRCHSLAKLTCFSTSEVSLKFCFAQMTARLLIGQYTTYEAAVRILLYFRVKLDIVCFILLGDETVCWFWLG